VSPCNSLSAGQTSTFTVHLLDSPAPDKTILVTLAVLNPSPLTATPSPASLSYTKGSGSAGHVDVTVTASSASFFTVDTTSLPIWLTVDSTTGTTPKSIRFSTTNISDTLAPGTYSGSVRLKVSGFGDLAVPVSLLVTNPAPRLSLAEGTTRNVSWVVGQNIPSLIITAVSSDSPIPYTITTGGTLSPNVSASMLQGLAYSFGTPIPVTFNPLVFAAAQPGQVLTGTVTFTWGSPAATIVVTISVAVQSAGATVTAITPASVPTAASGQVFNVVLSGSGFVPSSDPTQKTRVGIVTGGVITTDTNISANVVNGSNIILTITVPVVADGNLPFAPSGAGGSVTLGVCNPLGATCSIPTGTATLAIGTNPIIQSVTSASSFQQVNPGSQPNVAPFDMLSIFGTNFCTSGGTGCGSSQVLYGTPDPVTLKYPAALSPDNSGNTQRSLAVTFWTHGSSPTSLGAAPLLFATNSQINVLVPSAVAAQIGNPVDIVVTFGYGSGSTMSTSLPYTVNVTSNNPGIFTVGADGQGNGAVLNTSYALISATQQAGMRSTQTDSDTVQIYMTGLGVPDSAASNASAGNGPAAAWSTDCVTLASYLSSLNQQDSSNLSTLDGVVIVSAWLNQYRQVPCIASSSSLVPTVTIGGQPAPVSYAGWTPDSIAGLYQVNVQLPSTTATVANSGKFTTTAGTQIATITAPVQLPLVVTANGRSSQSGVNLWVAPRLKVSGPSGSGLTGTVGVAWASSNNVVAATEGTSPYRYQVTSGLLPSGLTLDASSGAISGMPAANTNGTYIVTVTATDSATIPVTGTVTFTLSIGAGLVMSASGSAPFHGTFGTANATVTTVGATGGVGPYTYAITAPSSLPAGLSIGSSTGIVAYTAQTPASTYHVTVTATDANGLTGNVTFDIAIALHVTQGSVSSVSGTNGGSVVSLTVTGNTGALSFAIDSTSTTNGFAIDSSGNLTLGSGSLSAGPYSVTVTITDGTAATGAASAGSGTTVVSVTVT
jgi:uncharacterized protein (TIGR03437 family)